MSDKPKLKPGMQVGDYYLKELISEGGATRTWYADQVSVKREVIVDSLRSAILNNDEIREAFLEDVRAKARVDHPLIGSVFEAVRMDDICFYARERLSGETLEALLTRGDKLTPSNVVHILRQIAEANMHMEQMNIGSIAIGPHQVYIDDGFLTRLVNMAIGEERDHSVSQADKVMLGSLFKGSLKLKEAGATRVSSLCDFMTDQSREIPITWEQIRDLSVEVEKQLREKSETSELAKKTSLLTEKNLGRNFGVVVGVAIVVLALVAGSMHYYYSPTKTKARRLDQMVSIDVEEVVVGPDTVKLRPFEIDKHEVTIAEYAEFLTAVKKNGTQKYFPEGAPEGIKTYTPEDWAEMYACAEGGLPWQGSVLGLNQPVVGVSYWSAMAYANWKGDLTDGEFVYTLPSEAHWLAALEDGKEKEITPSDKVAVDENLTDITSNGIHGLAGNVSEWSASEDFDIDGVSKLPIVLGASYLRKNKGALARQTVSSRRLQRSDVGFRLVKEEK